MDGNQVMPIPRSQGHGNGTKATGGKEGTTGLMTGKSVVVWIKQRIQYTAEIFKEQRFM